MTTRKRPAIDLRALCAQVHEEDGAAPRDRRDTEPLPSATISRKDRQLCKQVLRAVADACRARCADPAIESIDFVAAEPAPDARRLRLTATVAPYADTHATLARLNALRGALRAEVAAAICRKRTPEIVFHVLAREGGEV